MTDIPPKGSAAAQWEELRASIKSNPYGFILLGTALYLIIIIFAILTGVLEL
jgi:preprotein translocase subunit Sss1